VQFKHEILILKYPEKMKFICKPNFRHKNLQQKTIVNNEITVFLVLITIFAFFNCSNHGSNPKVVVYLYFEVPHNGWQQKLPIFLDKST
jgi:uncharacterized membrane protein YvbJ